MAALVKAYSKTRLIEPRLCGGFHAGKYDPAAGVALVDQASLSKAQDLILGDIGNRTDPDALSARGRLNLAMGQSKDALPLFEEAEKEMPNDAAEHNDFGACLYKVARYEDALDQFNAALELDHGMNEALFNRALCYQKLLLTETAIADFVSLLPRERDAGWRSEANTRREQLSKPPTESKTRDETIAEFDASISSGDREQAKQLIRANFDTMWGYLLMTSCKTYLRIASQGDATKASEALGRLDSAGELFVESMGDTSIEEEVKYLRGLSSEKRASELATLTSLTDNLHAARTASSAITQSQFEGLSETFARRGNQVIAFYSRFCEAGNLYTSNQYNASIGLLTDLLKTAEGHSWRYFQISILANLGIDYIRLGRDSLGIDYCGRAVGLASYPTVIAKTDQFISVGYWHLGDLENALRYLRSSTTVFLESIGDYQALSSNYLTAADIYRMQSNHFLALLYTREAIKFAGLAKADKLEAEALSFAANEEARLGRFDEARTDIESAFSRVGELDSTTRGYVEPLVYNRAGNVAVLQGNLATALTYFSKAEAIAESTEGDQVLLIDTLRGKANALWASHRFDDARSNLARAIDLIETYRIGIANYQERSRFLDVMQATFDQILLLDLTQSPSMDRDAFDMVERSRGRTLLDEINYQTSPGNHELSGASPTGRVKEDPRPTFDATQVMNSLPADLAVLEFAVTDQGTFIFVLKRSGIWVRQSKVTTDQLDKLVGDYMHHLKQKALPEGLSEEAKLLFQSLIAPVEELIGKQTRLCIIPDKALHFLTFAPLVAEDGRYLIEKYSISYCPSASVLVHCIQESRSKAAHSGSKTLVVGDPTFDRGRFPDLRPLSDSRVEARKIHDLYPGSTLLLDQQATEDKVRSELMTCQIAHFAAHVLVDERSPWQACVVLAKSEMDHKPKTSNAMANVALSSADGVLTLQEAYTLEMPHLRLVILSACESALGRYYRGEGIVSLVRPFIAARVPSVVATLWPVQSEATSDLMETFHRYRQAGNATSLSNALRQAQLRICKEEPFQAPYYWAAFITEGSDEN